MQEGDEWRVGLDLLGTMLSKVGVSLESRF